MKNFFYIPFLINKKYYRAMNTVNINEIPKPVKNGLLKSLDRYGGCHIPIRYDLGFMNSETSLLDISSDLSATFLESNLSVAEYEFVGIKTPSMSDAEHKFKLWIMEEMVIEIEKYGINATLEKIPSIRNDGKYDLRQAEYKIVLTNSSSSRI
jgi:hypothetical protein